MSVSRQTKSPHLEIALQITETTEPGAETRTWEVHDVERSRGFAVTLAGGHGVGQERIDVAIGLAIERALVTPPEKLAGETYPLAVTAQDLQDAASFDRP